MKERDKQISEFSKIETKVLGFAPETMKTDWENITTPKKGATINDITDIIGKSGEKKWSADEVIKLRTYFAKRNPLKSY